MAADYSRIHRLLRILTLIQGSEGWTARRLALECKVSERNIYRDLRMLEVAGIPYFFDRQSRCYRIRADFFMPPVQLTLDEALALTALSEHVGEKQQIPYMRPAARAIAKIRSVLPTSLRKELEAIEDHVAIRLAAAMPPEGLDDVYETVRQALAKKVALRCEYDSVSSNSDHRRNGVFVFKPYTLFFSQRAWYVVGHHDARNGLRCLKLNRFTRIELTGQSYAIPRSFSLEKHLGHAWRMIRGDKVYNVELHFDAEFAETIADTHWHETQEVTWNDDGSIVFRCKVEGLEEIVWWILSMGPHCVVKKPKELARRVKDLAREIVRRYA